MLPFFEESCSDAKTKIRTFKQDVISEDLTWHRDRFDRKVQVLQSRGWFFQRDDQLPIELKSGDVFNIPARTWHRIIKKNNCGDLVVKITE